MNSPANLRVRISADLADIKQGLGLLRGELAKVKQDAARTTPDTSKWSAGLGQVRKQLAGIVSVYAAMRGVQAYVRLADDAANLAGRLRLATKSQEEFTRAQQQTFAIAQSTSAEWGSIVNLYAQLAQTTGMGQERILALTKTISQAFTVSGASAQETANGLRQLQQAMAGGTLRAEEFNTIVETSPRIVQALADHFGIAFGEVRRHVNDGKISSEEFANALLNASADIQADFDKMPLTVGRAMQQVRNALLGLVGGADDASGASSDLAQSISDLARTLESPGVQQGFAAFIGGVTTATGALAQMLSTAASLTKYLAEDLAAAMHGAARGDIVRMEREAEGIRKQLEFLRKNPVMGGIASAYREKLGMASRDELTKRLETLRSGIREFYDTPRRGGGPADEAGATAPARVPPGSGGGNNKGAAAAMRAAQREAERLRREAEAAENALQRELEARGIRIAAGLEDAQIAMLEATGNSAEAAAMRIDARWKSLLDDLAAAGDTAGTELVNRVISLEKFQARMDELKQTVGTAMSDLRALENGVATQVSAGMLDPVEGERRIQEAREATIAQLSRWRQGLVDGLAAMSPGSPEHAAAIAGIAMLDENMASLANTADDLRVKMAAQMSDVAIGSLSNFFMDLVEGSKSASEALRDFVSNFLMGMAQIAARALATYLVLQMLDAMYPGLGKAVAASMNAGWVFGGQNHDGGLAGKPGGVRRQIPAALLGVAPRYHSGGIAGLAPNEVPAILERGEEVLTRNDPRHRDNLRGDGGGGGPTPVTVIAAFSESELANAATGKAFEQVVIAHVRNNSRALGIGG